MGWSGVWPVLRHDAAGAGLGGEIWAALEERGRIAPGGELPGVFERYGPLRATSSWHLGTMSGLQLEIAAMLSRSDNQWRWWDRARMSLYDLPTLLGDALGQGCWSRDLTALVNPTASAVPAEALIWNELRTVVNRMRCLRRVSASGLSRRRSSLYWLTWDGGSFAAERAEAFSQMQGQDDEVWTGLTYDLGLSGLVFDSYADRQWYIDCREMEVRFDTSALAGFSIGGAWLEVTIAAAPGGTDFSSDFTIEVVGAGGAVRGSFSSSAAGVQQVALAAADVAAGGDAVLVLRMAGPASADRTAWAAGGADWTSSYREGVMLGGVVRLVVEVNFEYSGT